MVKKTPEPVYQCGWCDNVGTRYTMGRKIVVIEGQAVRADNCLEHGDASPAEMLVRSQ
jgi:hypothetical protein